MNPTNSVMGDIARVNTMNQGFGGRSIGGVPNTPRPSPKPNGLLQSAQRFLKNHVQNNELNMNGTGRATGLKSGSNYIGSYNDPSVGVKSFGARLGGAKNFVAGNIGTSNGKPFGNANINGRIIGQFGPQGK